MPERSAAVRNELLVPFGLMLILFLGAYLLRVIPPVPLSVPFIGVYHAVERTPEGYRLSHERQRWAFWRCFLLSPLGLVQASSPPFAGNRSSMSA